MKPPRGHSNTDAYIDLVLAEAERDASPAPEINDTLACEPPDFSDIPDPEAAPLDEFDEEEPTHAFDRERGGAAPADPWRAPPPARVTGAPLKAKRTPPKAPPSLEMPFVAEPSVMIDLPELIEIKPAASPMEAGPRGAWARAGDLPSDSVIFELPEMSAVLEEEETPPRPRAVPRLGALAAEVTLDAAAARAARAAPAPTPTLTPAAEVTLDARSRKRAKRPRLAPQPRAVVIDPAKETGYLQLAAPGQEPPRARLRLAAGEAPGKIWYLNREVTQIGRGDESDIALNDLGISRSHLRIERHDDGFRFVDMKSANGTRLNARRVQEGELYDGDQIQIGEHILVFESMGAPRVRGRAHETTRPGFSISPAFFTPRSLALWSLITFVMVFGLMYITQRLLGDPPQAEASAEVEVYQRRALESIQRREWQRALEDLRIIHQLDPTQDTATLWAQVEREAAQEARLIEATRRFGAGAFEEIEGLEVDPDSVYAEEAARLKRRAVEAAARARVQQASAAFEAGRLKRSRRLLQEVLLEHPAHPEALRMMEEIRQDEEATRRANPKTLRQVREETAQAKAYYQEARFREAHAELERAWRRDVPRRLKNQAKDRARWLQALHGHWLALARAEARGEGEAAISALEAALDLDGRLWGAHTAKLQARLNAQLYRQGYWAFKDARYVEAGEAARRILKASPKHPEARALLDAVEARAAQLFAAAQSNEISAPERARRLAVEAQRIGGEGSAVYGQAAALLARLSAP